MAVAVVLLAIAVGVLTLLVFGLLRTHAEILRALDRAGISLDDDGSVAHQPVGPVPIDSPSRPPGRGAHDVVGTVPAGGPTKVSVTGVNHLTLLAFLSSGCRTCQGFWDAFADPDLQLPGGDTRLVIVGQDPIYDSESALAALVPNGIKTVLSTAAWQEYDVPGSPYFCPRGWGQQPGHRRRKRHELATGEIATAAGAGRRGPGWEASIGRTAGA